MWFSSPIPVARYIGACKAKPRARAQLSPRFLEAIMAPGANMSLNQARNPTTTAGKCWGWG